MNAIFAIRLFSVKNLPILANEVRLNVDGMYYPMSYVLWYATISVDDFDRSQRLVLLAMTFYILQSWLRIVFWQTYGKLQNVKLPGAKYFAELVDVIRYSNSVIL
jgi:hypothetical protein